MNPSVKPPAGSGWRVWFRALHRDVGYLGVALTLVYGISGLAVNHKAHWNPSRSTVRKSRDLGPFDPNLPEAGLVAEALRRMDLHAPLRGSFQPDPETLQVFLDGWTCSIDLPTGKTLQEGVRPRPVLAALNQMHLNETKGLWVWVADAYALALIFLAVTGLFILKGRKGLTGRGKWFAAAGAVVPLAFWAGRTLIR